MCGIAGFFEPEGFSDERALDLLTSMTSCLAHRGPDDSGVWTDAAQGIALGHRRLSILDLSPLGHQPMLSRDGRFVIVYNGEIYNHHDLRDELAALGHAFRGHSDTEVLVTALVQWGLRSTLQRCNGMFAFAAWDRAERRLHLARDRAGEKPLYYGTHGGTFYFASELKSLRAHDRFRGEIDRDSLRLFLRHNCVPAPFSIYAGIAKLPPGTFLSIGAEDVANRPVPESYWSWREVAERAARDPFTGDAREAVDALDELLRDAVKIRMEADVPLGAFLSGGVDSSTIVALMQAQSSERVRSFTIGFHEQGYDEAVHARAVARYLGTDHTELYVTPGEALAVIPRLPKLYDEPFSDSSQVPTFLVSELARRHVTVSLSGDAGDELFGGYDRYMATDSLWGKLNRIPLPLRRLAAAGLNGVSPRRWNQLLGPFYSLLPSRVRQYSPGARMHQIGELLRMKEPTEVYTRLTSHWRGAEDVVLGSQERATVVTDRSRWASVDELSHQLMYLDSITYLPDDILVKVDRASMGVSLESRVPLLDHRVIELAWRLPLSLKMRNGRGKWVLRQVLDRYVPRTLIERPKMGFGVPIHTWLRGPLRDWAEALLDEKRLREEGYFQPEPIRTRWAEHLSGNYDRHYDLWDVLMFQAWLEENREERASARPEGDGAHAAVAGRG